MRTLPALFTFSMFCAAIVSCVMSDSEIKQLKRASQQQESSKSDLNDDSSGYIRVDAKMKNTPQKLGKKWVAYCDISAQPKAKYSWYKDGKLLRNSNRIRISDELYGNKLRINKVKSSDAGYYNCTAVNPHGSVSTGAHVSIRTENRPTNENAFPPQNKNQNSLNRENDRTNDEAFCQPFSSSTCAKYLSQEDVHVRDELQQSTVESKIAHFLVSASSIVGARKDPHNCMQDILKAVCHYNFPICSSDEEKMFRICHNECSQLVQYRCKDFLTELRRGVSQSISDLLPDCANLPADSSRFCAAPIVATSPASAINQDLTDNCYHDNGRDYTGKMATTHSGKSCLKWSMFPEYAWVGNHSECRNPGTDSQYGAPWCFTSPDGRVELCKMLRCESKPLIKNVEMWFFTVCAVLGILCVVLILFLVFCCWWRKSRCKYSAIKQLKQSRHQPAHVISRHSMEMIARNNYLNHHSSVTDFPLHKIRFGDAIGEGKFGKVYRGDLIGMHNETSITPIVIKTLTVMESGTERKSNFQQEASKLGELVHPNVMQLIGVSMKQPSPWCQIFELLSLNDLHENLVQQRCLYTSQYLPSTSNRYETSEAFATAGMDVSIKLQYAIEICEGMEFLSSQNFVHRDLATRNILFGGDLQCKISDLASTRQIYTADYYLLKPNSRVPIRWMPPEAILYGEFSVQSDIWSFGVVLWEIWTLALPPYGGFSNTDVIELTRTRNLLQVPEECPSLIRNLMFTCWNEKATMRPSFTEILHQLRRLRDSPECLTESTYDRPHSMRVSSVPLPLVPPQSLTVRTPLTDTVFNAAASSPESVYSCAAASELKNSQSLNTRFDLNLNRSQRGLTADKCTF